MRSPRYAGYIVAAVVLALLLGGAVTVSVASSPKACVSCHRGLVAASASSPHSSTGCVACHAPGVSGRVALSWAELTRMVPGALVGAKPSGPVLETSRDACLTCHEDVLAGLTSGTGGYKINHATCAPGATCDSCHSTTAHGAATRWKRQPIMEDCTSCHTRKGASVECATCHTGRDRKERVAVGPWQVTHGPNWQQTHGLGALDSCVTCHPRDYCVRCHGVEVPHPATFGSEHGQAAIADRASCTVCHKSAALCDSCHGVAMPHADGYLKIHSTEAKSIDNPRCMRCHSVLDCVRCHERHVHPGNAKESAGLHPSQPPTRTTGSGQ